MADNSPAPNGANIAYFSDGTVLRDLGRLDGCIESNRREIDELKADIKELRKEHAEYVKKSEFKPVSDKVEKLEHWKIKVASIAAVVATLATLLIKSIPFQLIGTSIG